MICETCKDYGIVYQHQHVAMALSGHHPNCPHYHGVTVVIRAAELIDKLVTGIEAWAADEDGVHDAVFEVYEEARRVVAIVPPKTSRDDIEVNQIKLTPQQMRDAMDRASKHVETLVRWEDKRTAPQEDKS